MSVTVLFHKPCGITKYGTTFQIWYIRARNQMGVNTQSTVNILIRMQFRPVRSFPGRDKLKDPFYMYVNNNNNNNIIFYNLTRVT